MQSKHLNILALDTSTKVCSVALLANDRMFERQEAVPQKHGQLLLPMIESLLVEAGLSLEQLNAIAFGVGPGSFTGLRIGIGVVQGLAFASKLPVIPVSSLQAIAENAHDQCGADWILVATDARMQQVYLGVYNVATNGLMEKVIADRVSPLSEISDIEGIDGYVGVGNAWKEYEEDLTKVLQDKVTIMKGEYYPLARYIAEIAVHSYSNNEFKRASEALPVYLSKFRCGK